MRRFFLLLLVTLTTISVAARETYPLNSGWRFFTVRESDTTTVSLPHCYPATYSGSGNYVRHINIRADWSAKRLFLHFTAAGTVASVFVNGNFMGEHRGGGTAFDIEITGKVNFGARNLVQVVVSNATRADVLPTASTGVQWGGLYRTAELVVTDAVMIDEATVKTTKVNQESAAGNITVKVNASSARSLTVELSIVDPSGEEVFSDSKKISAAKGATELQIPFAIANPQLWNGTKGANLYTITVKAGGDELKIRTGFRYFSAANGFQLNGEPYPLRGVTLWRDRPLQGGIASRQELEKDLDIIAEMGANAVRIAEGAYSEAFYDLCDERGIVVMSDLPFVGEPTFLGHGYYPTSDFRTTAQSQFREQITEQFNHPSIIFWGVFTTPTLRGDNPLQFIRDLNKFVKTIDTQRFTVGVSNRDGELNQIPDLIVWEHHLGWREGLPDDIALWRDQLFRNSSWRQLHSAVSYRAGGDITVQSSERRRPDPSSAFHPEGWQTYFHRTYIQALGSDNRFWAIWAGDMFDYVSLSAPSGSATGMTDYGLVTANRTTRKDAYYLYKAVWGAERFVYIAGRRNSQRVDATQNIMVFSTCDSVSLIVNGAPISTLHSSGGVFVWEKITLHEGVNIITATGDGDQTDTVQLVIVKELI